MGGGKLTLVPHQNVLHSKNERVGTCFAARGLDKISAMILSLRHLLGGVIGALGSRRDLLLENLALRQQLLSLHAKCPGHPSKWKAPLVLVTPRTVVEWHRAGFRLYWKWLSRARQVAGRKPVSCERKHQLKPNSSETAKDSAPLPLDEERFAQHP